MNRSTVIFPVSQVNDIMAQVRYQRVLALAKRYRVVVVTKRPLPESLKSLVHAEHVVRGKLSMIRKSLALAREMTANNTPYFVHTEYTGASLAAGYLIKRTCRAPWVYDLYDHPSLSWSSARGVVRLLRPLAWRAIFRRMVSRADAWIIGMHPGILSHLPKPNALCRLIFTQPGVLADIPARSTKRSRGPEGSEIVICYAGHVAVKRGIRLILDWASQYDGPPARLELMGRHDDAVVRLVDAIRKTQGPNPRVRIRLHGHVPHQRVLALAASGDIGICLLDQRILNYRYAYPVKVLEYMKAGLVPVATSSHGVRAFVRHGVNGYVCDYSRSSFSEGMKQAIETCLDENRLAGVLAEACTSVEKKDWPTVNDRLVQDLSGFLDGKLEPSLPREQERGRSSELISAQP